MLRHKMKAGITGWAQINGWRGNTSLERRIEHDLYYIEALVDLVRFQNHAAHRLERLYSSPCLLIDFADVL